MAPDFSSHSNPFPSTAFKKAYKSEIAILCILYCSFCFSLSSEGDCENVVYLESPSYAVAVQVGLVILKDLELVELSFTLPS